MPHYCWCCGVSRRNEAFSGRGHRDHICRKCQSLPSEERARRRALCEMERMLDQSRISEKNVTYLRGLAASPSPDVAEWAAVLLEIARIHPYRRRRYAALRRHRRLWGRMARLGIVADYGSEEPEPYEAGRGEVELDEVELGEVVMDEVMIDECYWHE